MTSTIPDTVGKHSPCTSFCFFFFLFFLFFFFSFKFLASEEIKACTQLTEMKCRKPGGHQKVVIKVQCHPSHSGPGSPRNLHGNTGSRCKLRQQRLPHPEGYRVGILIPKSPSVTGKAAPKGINSPELSTCSVGNKASSGQEKSPWQRNPGAAS